MPQQLEVTGLRQSPIDIKLESTVQSNRRTKRNADANNNGTVGDDSPLKVDYSAITGTGVTIENTGHGWKLNIPDEVAQKCQITGGPLGTDEYRLLQVHAHWGKDSSTGSEHTLSGKRFPAEIHLVHWDVTKYSSPEEAQLCSGDGLAVIGVFVEISTNPNQVFEQIIEQLPNIMYKGDKSLKIGQFNLNELLPSPQKYWNYPGSLTTPPYSESVIWIVMETPVGAQESQIAKFRELNENEKDNDSHVVAENFRDVQPIHNREVLRFD